MTQPIIFVVSDSLGETAELVARAAASQFGDDVEMRRIPYVDDEEMIVGVIEEAAANRPCMILYTLISPRLRQQMDRRAAQLDIPSVDLMGPVLQALSVTTGRKPKMEAGLIHKLDEAYFKRIEAIEFAVKYDDGKSPSGLAHADIVLIGVSRTSKTPVSMYLAHRNYKVANVPLVPEVEPPEQLFRLDPRKIIGLTIRPDKLQEIRQERLRGMGLDPDNHYGDRERIHEELRYAQDIFLKLGCAVVDVSNKAIEETAARVLTAYRGQMGASSRRGS